MKTRELMVSQLRLDFLPPSRGWMPVILTAGADRLEFSASYTPRDSVCDLARLVSALLHGETSQTISWYTEPLRYEFRFETKGQRTRLEVFQFPDHRQEDGRVVLIVEEETQVLGLSLWRSLRRLQGQVATAEYEAEWGHPFPGDVVEQIARRIRTKS